MDFKRNVLITGGAGFIGSHVVRLFVTKYPEYHIINLDKLTYAGNLANLADIEQQPNYTFVKDTGIVPAAQYRRSDPSGSGKPCRPLDQRSVYLCSDECDGDPVFVASR